VNHQHACAWKRGEDVPGNIAVHLVDANHELLDTEEVDEHGVLAGLALDLSGLGVALGDGRGEVTVGWHHQKAHIGLRRARDHVLDEIPVTGGVNDGVVVRRREELLGGARDGDTTLTLLLLAVHVEREGERACERERVWVGRGGGGRMCKDEGRRKRGVVNASSARNKAKTIAVTVAQAYINSPGEKQDALRSCSKQRVPRAKKRTGRAGVGREEEGGEENEMSEKRERGGGANTYSFRASQPQP
jgi:hypothetical protein